MLPERSGKQQQQQLSQKVSAGQASDQRKRREREGHISPQRSPLGTNQSLPSASDTCSERCRSAQQVPIPQLLGPRLRLRPLLPATRPGPLTCAHKIQKHFVSKIDFFIKKTANKPLTKSQKANLARAERVANLRDNKIDTKQKESSIWD